MNSLLSALYNLLCFITEDATAHKLLPRNLPPELWRQLNNCATALGEYLDEQENLRQENVE